ncbi:MAG: 5'/3'-nucleotidase SurE [Firmicutes bacterium]|nr:5'/3'-nucleotidase SurE [Bacillota bacterium]
MKLVITNDDGLFAPGVRTLAEALAPFGDITVIAPSREQSGMSHAITVDRPLRMEKMDAIPGFENRCFMVDGTPADCVKMAVHGLGLKPDMVVSGINIGENLGTDVLYSGTVSAAIEAVLLGIPAVAVSQVGGELKYLKTAAEVVSELFRTNVDLLRDQLVPPDGLLNINVPDVEFKALKGIKVTRLGNQEFRNRVEARRDPRGKLYYWMTGARELDEPSDLEVDYYAVQAGYVSITPIHFDLTYHHLIPKLKPHLELEFVPTRED